MSKIKPHKIDRRKKAIIPHDCLPVNHKPTETMPYSREMNKVQNNMFGKLFLKMLFVGLNEITKEYKKPTKK